MMRPAGALAAALLIPCIAAGPGSSAASGADEPAPASAPAGRSLATVLGELDAMLLAGESLPPDFLLGLSHLPPGERLLVVVHVRRAGLLTGPALPLSDLLATAGGDQR